MADAPEPKGGGGTFGFLGKKIFGKVPVWVIAVGAVGGYYWYTHYGPGKKAAAQQPQTDPAGNVCAAINPDTGYCPGSVEDTAALQAQAQAGAGTGADTAGTPEPPEPPEPQEPPVWPPVIPSPYPRRRRRPRQRVTSNWPGGRQPPPPHPRRRPPKHRPTPRPGPGTFIPGPGRPVPQPVPMYAPGTHGSVYASTG